MHHLFKKGNSVAPVFVLLHGTGGDEESLLPITPHLDPVASILSIRGNIIENGARRFFKRLAEGVYDIEDLYKRGKELYEFILFAADHYQFELSQVVLVGFSNGANIAINLLLEYPKHFKKGILFSPMYPLESQNKGLLENTQVLITTGKHDPICSIEDSEHVVNLFNKRSAQVDHLWGQSHSIDRGHLLFAREWLKN